MANTNYTVLPVNIESITQYQKYDPQDTQLIESFEINSAFDTNKNVSELHIFSNGNTLLRSISNYLNYRVELGSGGSQDGATSLTIDPLNDALSYGYRNGNIKLLYLFYNNLFADLKLNSKLYISAINNDRTELKLSSTGISNEDLKRYALQVKEKINDTSYFSEFRLNFGNNTLQIGINIDYLDDEEVVTVKLYEALPSSIGIKSTLDIIEFTSNPLAYEITAEFIPDVKKELRLREANFNLDLDDNAAVPSQYFSYDELFSYGSNNSNHQILSLFNEKSAEISINHEDYSNFIHFSSAEERLVNFKYKLDLIKNYEVSVENINNSIQGSSGISNDAQYYSNLITGIVENFDHYERFLYFESGSYSWPKVEQTTSTQRSEKPYTNLSSSESEAITWFANQRTLANNYDVSNFNALTNTIPSFIREDSNNEKYTLFIQMLGQHFDKLFLYAKAVTDKYDADNRIDIGISRDLVEEAVKSLGVKLYNSSKSLDNLFKYFIGEFAPEDGEVINEDITAGDVISGGDVIEGSDQGFSVNYIDAGRFHNYPAIISAFAAAKIQPFPAGTTGNVDGDFSTNFDNSYFNNNEGGEVFITFTDETETSHGPYKYILTNQGNLLNLASGRIRYYNGSKSFIIHPTDAEDTPGDHSDLFAILNSNNSSIELYDVKIEDKRVTSTPKVVRKFNTISQDIYQKSIYKRIYHNLPFLLKTKGTQRGLRALINCFGIPEDILSIKTFGGRDINKNPFLGYKHFSTNEKDRIRTTNSGSIVEGDTLSRYTSIVKDDYNYTEDLHNIEVGFSPSDNIDSIIKDTLGLSFNIDDYIGDPRDLTLENYSDLFLAVRTALSSVTERYEIKDFIRLIKFFDNVIFKMIKDFVPARSTTDTGIIIRPNILDRSKAKSVIGTFTTPQYSGSLDTAFSSGSNPGAYQAGATGSLRFDSLAAIASNNSYSSLPGEVSTRRVGKFVRVFPHKENSRGTKSYGTFRDHGQDEAKFDGELANSIINVSTGELNIGNNLKQLTYPFIGFNVTLFKDAPSNTCYLSDDDSIFIIGNFTGDDDHTVALYPTFFTSTSGTTGFYIGLNFANGQPVNLSNATQLQNGVIFIDADDPNSFPQYDTFTVTAYDPAVTSEVLNLAPSCAATRTIQVVRCKLAIESGLSTTLVPGTTYNLTNRFNGTSVNSNYIIKVNGTIIPPGQRENYTWQQEDTTLTIEDAVDSSCSQTIDITTSTCPITVAATPSNYISEGNPATIDILGVFGNTNINTGNNDDVFAVRFLTNSGQSYGFNVDGNSNEGLFYELLQPYGPLAQELQSEGYTYDDYIHLPFQSEQEMNEFPITKDTFMTKLYGPQWQSTQFDQGVPDIQEVSKVQFKVYRNTGCQPSTVVFDFADSDNDTTYSARSITVTIGNECYVCHGEFSTSGTTVELFYFANQEHDIHSLYTNGMHLFISDQTAAALEPQGQVQVANLIGPAERMDDDPVAYEYPGDQSQDLSGNPWGDIIDCDIDRCREEREDEEVDRT